MECERKKSKREREGEREHEIKPDLTHLDEDGQHFKDILRPLECNILYSDADEENTIEEEKKEKCNFQEKNSFRKNVFLPKATFFLLALNLHMAHGWTKIGCCDLGKYFNGFLMTNTEMFVS